MFCKFHQRCVLCRTYTASVVDSNNINKRKFDHITADVRDSLHWLPLQQRVEYKVSLLIYKCLHQAAPSCLAEMCVPVSATDNRCHLRSATHGDLAVPRVRLARYRRRSFFVSGPLLWNSLPLTVEGPDITLEKQVCRSRYCKPPAVCYELPRSK